MMVGVPPFPALISVSQCQICNLKFSNTLHAQNHFISKKHKSEVQTKIITSSVFRNLNFQKRWLIINQTMMVDVECFLCLKQLPSEGHRSDHLVSKGHEANVNDFFNELESKDMSPVNVKCILCNVTLASREEKAQHISAFPHFELVNEKINSLKKGITEDYCRINADGTVHCYLCNAQKLTNLSILPHFIGKKHLNKLNQIDSSSKNLAASNANVFYCQLCDKNLDGTTEAEKHYTYPSHLKKKLLYCFECNIASADEQGKQAHDSIFHKRIFFEKSVPMKALPTTISTSQNPKTTTEALKTNLPSRHWYENVLDPKFSEISKSFRETFDSLKFATAETQPLKLTSEPSHPLQLPKIRGQASNTSITEIPDSLPMIRKPSESSLSKVSNSLRSLKIEDQAFPVETPDQLNFQEIHEQVPESFISEIPVVQISYPVENQSSLKEEVFQELEKLVQKLYYSKTVPYDVGLQYLRKFNDELEELSVNRLQGNANLPPEDCESVDYASLENIEERIDKKIIEAKQQTEPFLSKEEEDISISDRDVKAQEASPAKKTPSDKFKDLLDKITIRKAEVDWNNPQEITEKELLGEIEQMIKLTQEESLPPDKVLECLINFNRELDGFENIENPPPLDPEIEQLEKIVIECLDKIELNQPNHNSVINKIRQQIDSFEKCEIVLNLILQRVVKPQSASRYVEFIERIEYFKLKHSVGEKIEIKAVLQTKCCKEFNLYVDIMKNNVDEECASSEKTNVPRNDEMFFAFLRFLGTLFNHGFFSSETLKKYLKILRDNNDITSLRAFCVLYGTVHHVLESDLMKDTLSEITNIADGRTSIISDNLKTVMENLIEKQWSRFSYMRFRTLAI